MPNLCDIVVCNPVNMWQCVARAIGIYEYINIKESVFINLIDEQRADDNDDDKILIHRAIAYTGMPSHTYEHVHIWNSHIHNTTYFQPNTALRLRRESGQLSLMTTEKKVQDIESSLNLSDSVTDIFK